MNHAHLERKALYNLHYRDMSKQQRELLTQCVLRFYFTKSDNTPSAIAAALHFKKGAVQNVISRHVFPGADLKKLKKLYGSTKP